MIKQGRAGKGMYGIVYYGRDEEQQYAIKRNLIDHNVSFLGSLRELDLLSRVKGHPYLVKLLTISYGTPFQSGALSPLRKGDMYRDDEIHFIFERASEDGCSLLSRSPSSDEIRMIMVQVLLGVEYLHARGIVHRDLKPSNLLYFPEQNAIKICDFGLSKFYTSQGCQTPRIVTSWYRAPEIVCGASHGYPVDIWSLGCIFYELLTGNPLFLHAPEEGPKLLAMITRVFSPDKAADVHALLTLGKKKWHAFTFNSKLEEFFQNQKWREYVEVHSVWKEFSHLLFGLLEIQPGKRLTATQALNHPFFAGCEEMIRSCREQFPPVPPLSPLLAITASNERKKVFTLAHMLYQYRTQYPWYTHRILFHSLDYYDRYLEWKSMNKQPESDDISIHIQYFSCLYLAIKYFTSVSSPPGYTNIVPEKYGSPENIAIAEQFEKLLLQQVFNYAIYRETIYEASDYYKHTLTEEEVVKLLNVYANLDSCMGITARRLFRIFLFALE